jgi:hypothetical protein
MPPIINSEGVHFTSENKRLSHLIKINVRNIFAQINIYSEKYFPESYVVTLAAFVINNPYRDL